jgi:Ca-activated chloride channel homolog
MNSFIEEFHFVRPLWLLAILLILPLIALLWRQQKNSGQWQHLISAELLPFLLEGKTVKHSRGSMIVLLLSWIIAAIALAGPSWQKLPVAVEKNSSAMVIILDLSPSMLTEDIKPSRIVRARLKIADLLRERQDGQTALLVYGADAHVVVPLTQDAKTINNLLPMLSPSLMPAQGSNTEAAIARAIKMLKDAGLDQGDLLLITDGVTEDAQDTINKQLSTETSIRLSILGAGGKTPAPIPSRNGGFIRDKSNNIVTSFLDTSSLNRFATENRGRYKTLSSDVDDMKVFASLANAKIETDKNQEQKISNRTFDQWADAGHWLVLLLLPVILYLFRRGTLAAFLIIPLIFSTSENTYAMSWNDLWKNKDQQAYEKLESNPGDAAKEFTQNEWKASAEYRSGNFAEAAKQFTQDTAAGHYNRGNALAKSGQLADAIKAYDRALQLDPAMDDAKNNRKIVEDTLKKQQKQEQQQNQDQQQDQKDKEQQNKEQQNQEQQEKEQQQKEQQEKEQQQNQQEQNSSQQNQQDSQSGQNSSAMNQQMQNTSASSATSEAAMQQDSQETSSSSAASAAQAQKEKSEAEKEAEAKALAELEKDGLTDEERKKLEQWLRRVQDDPSGLLRRKFEYEFRKQQYEKMNGTWESPDNEADQRL